MKNAVVDIVGVTVKEMFKFADSRVGSILRYYEDICDMEENYDKITDKIETKIDNKYNN